MKLITIPSKKKTATVTEEECVEPLMSTPLHKVARCHICELLSKQVQYK